MICLFAANMLQVSRWEGDFEIYGDGFLEFAADVD